MSEELKDKAQKGIQKYYEEQGLEDIGDTGLSERFIGTWGTEYQQAGDEFLNRYLDTKFYEGF